LQSWIAPQQLGDRRSMNPNSSSPTVSLLLMLNLPLQQVSDQLDYLSKFILTVSKTNAILKSFSLAAGIWHQQPR